MEEINPKRSLDFKLDDKTTTAIATTVYIIDTIGNVLLLHQTKPNTVVPNSYVGIGGKVSVLTYTGESSEKVSSQKVISSLQSGYFCVDEGIRDVACREVKEEIGISLKKERLKEIGNSEVRLLNERINEMWYIRYFIYYIDGSEGEITDCNEGDLEWFPIQRIKQVPMFLHDKIIFKEKDTSCMVQAIYDDINQKYQLRLTKEKEDKKLYVMVPDINTPDTSKGIITAKANGNIPEEYKCLLKYIPEEKIIGYLNELGEGEQIIGEISYQFDDVGEIPSTLAFEK